LLPDDLLMRKVLWNAGLVDLKDAWIEQFFLYAALKFSLTLCGNPLRHSGKSRNPEIALTCAF
jgi:hypothetical protein